MRRPQARFSSRGRALLALLIVTVIWGWSFPWMKQALLETERVWGRPGGVEAVALFMLLRFGIAALLLAVLLPGARRGWDAGAARGGLQLGVLLLGGFMLQMMGLEEVSPAASAFLTSLYVVFSAILVAAVERRRPRSSLILGVGLATLGAGFISGPPQLTFGRGEWLTVGCAVIFAAHILVTDTVTRRHAPLAANQVSFVVVAGGCALILAGSWALTGRPRTGELAALVAAPGFLQPLLLSVVFATCVALPLAMVHQKVLDPVRAAVLYALEPVWAAIIAQGLGLGSIDRWLLIGGGALLAGNLVAELGPRLRPARGGG